MKLKNVEANRYSNLTSYSLRKLDEEGSIAGQRVLHKEKNIPLKKNMTQNYLGYKEPIQEVRQSAQEASREDFRKAQHSDRKRDFYAYGGAVRSTEHLMKEKETCMLE